jgi:hypothetical protein
MVVDPPLLQNLGHTFLVFAGVLESIASALVSPVVLVLTILGFDPIALTGRATGCYELPPDIHAAAELRLPIARLLARSRTLRAQRAAIAAARGRR